MYGQGSEHVHLEWCCRRLDWWLRCLPLDKEVDGIFMTPARQLLSNAINTPCIYTKVSAPEARAPH